MFSDFKIFSFSSPPLYQIYCATCSNTLLYLQTPSPILRRTFLVSNSTMAANQHGCKLLKRNRPPHSFPWNVQLTWSISLLLNDFLHLPPTTLHSFPSLWTINKAGL